MQDSKKIQKILLVDFVLSFLLLAYLGGSYYFSGEIIAGKHRSLEEDRVFLKINDFSDFNLPKPEDISFESDGIPLKAWLFRASKPSGCGIILSHGFTSSRWGVLKYAPIFRKYQCHIFTFDHRHHGESGGAYSSFGYHEKEDLKKALEVFSEMVGLETKKIGILGESFGAATGLQFAGKYPDIPIRFLISESGFQDMESIIRKKAVEIYGEPILALAWMALKIAGWRGDFPVEEVSPAEAAKKIQIPVLLVHSDSDEYTPPEHSRIIYENLGTKEKMLVFTDWGAPHARSVDRDPEKFFRILDEFFRSYKLLP